MPSGRALSSPLLPTLLGPLLAGLLLGSLLSATSPLGLRGRGDDLPVSMTTSGTLDTFAEEQN